MCVCPDPVLLLLQGDPGNFFYIVAKGSLSIKGGGGDKRSLHVGDHFGEVALIKQEPRNATVRREALLCPMGAATL